MTEIQPVYGIPALTVDRTLVIGDLHIGWESHLRKKGFHLVSRTNEMMAAIEEAAGDFANRLVVLGDVKDSVPGTSKQEYAEIPDFFERLLEMFGIVDLVRGNHDTEIEEFLPGKVRIRPASGMKIGDTGFVHGHTWPSEDVMDCDTLVMAHNHPAVMFLDGIGRRTTEPCWLRGSFRTEPDERFPVLPRNFIVVPAFNRMLGGSPVNSLDDGLLGPVLNSGLPDLDNARIYLLDGLDLGRRGDLMVSGRDSKKRSGRTAVLPPGDARDGTRPKRRFRIGKTAPAVPEPEKKGAEAPVLISSC